jgi:phage-related protein
VSPNDKPIGWLGGEIKSPPLSRESRVEIGFLLRRLQQRASLSMPVSKPMPSIAARCHELRVSDSRASWRVIYRIDDDAILVLEVFAKKTPKTPKNVIETCRRRLKEYDSEDKDERQ